MNVESGGDVQPYVAQVAGATIVVSKGVSSMRFLRAAAVLAVGVVAISCGSEDAATTTVDLAATTAAPATAPPAEPVTTDLVTTSSAATSSTTAEAASTTTESASTTTEPSSTTSSEPASSTTVVATTTTDLAPTTTPTMVDVRVYLLRGERLAIVHRQVEGPGVVSGALGELLAGPDPDEETEGLFSVIPEGTSLLGVDLDDGIATVDLSGEYETGGGSMSMLARIAQVVFTATQFDNVDAVRFWMDGAPIEFLGGEGIVLDEPLTRSDVPRELTAGILFDLPQPGSTVTSPFIVTGEGDVFEGDFPLRVVRDGVQFGEVLIVRAGAWGAWSDFEVTVTVDAAPGPIQLVAVDESGCGPPECPLPTEVVLSLELAS